MDPLFVLIILIGAVSVYAWNNHELMYKCLFIPTEVKDNNQFYRFLSSGFIHADYMHLGFNLFVLWNFGEGVQYGFKAHFGAMANFHLIGLFLFGVIVSEIPSYIKHQNNPNYQSLGASGGVAAVVFAFILLFPTSKLTLFFMLPIPAVLYAVGYLAYSSYQNKRNGDNINHSAHFWGSLSGLAYALVFKPQLGLYFVEQIFG